MSRLLYIGVFEEQRRNDTSFDIPTNNCGSRSSSFEPFSRSREFNVTLNAEFPETLQGRLGGSIGVVKADAAGYLDRDGERVEALIGCDNPNMCRPLTSAPWGSLLGQIGDGPLFHVGNQTSFAASNDGILALRINYYNHNAVTGCPYGDGGEITVGVNITPP